MVTTFVTREEAESERAKEKNEVSTSDDNCVWMLKSLRSTSGGVIFRDVRCKDNQFLQEFPKRTWWKVEHANV